MPLDGPSAGLKWVLTYCVLRMVHQPSTAPVLLPKILMPGKDPMLRIVLTRSSIPTASAHPMSRPPDFQFGRSRHARHRLPMTTPMPTVELASEYPWTSMIFLPPGISREMEGEERVFWYQTSTSKRLSRRPISRFLASASFY